MSDSEMTEKEGETKKFLLTEFYCRSRMYASWFWQLPFAYLGVVGIALTASADEPSKTSILGSITISIMGVLVLWIMAEIYAAIESTITKIKIEEASLNITNTAERRSGIIMPYFVIVMVGMITNILAAYIK